MATNSRFSLAVHILSFLTLMEDQAPIQSERLARSVNTNPAVIRTVLGYLAAAGITASRLGVGGGAYLVMRPESIDLYRVYMAVGKTEVFALHHSTPSIHCFVGRNIESALQCVTDKVEQSVKTILSDITILDVVSWMKSADQSGGGAPPSDQSRSPVDRFLEQRLPVG